MNQETHIPTKENNVIPHCTFRPAKLEDIFYMLHKTVENNMFDGMIYKVYPELRELLSDTGDEEERKNIENRFFSEVLAEEQESLQKSTLLFQKEWDLIEAKVVETLSGIVEQEWEQNSFDVRVSINPICPRYLKLHAFDVFYRQNLERMKAITTHELLHFIYFNKFASIFPEISKEEYNRPHLAWHLSEIVPGIILNDHRMQEVFEYNHESYKRYYEIRIEKKTLMEYIQGIYNLREDFEDFLRKAWQFVQKNEEVIKS